MYGAAKAFIEAIGIDFLAIPVDHLLFVGLTGGLGRVVEGAGHGGQG